MYKLITILLLFCYSNLQSQSKLSEVEVDKKTYDYYINNKWEELIKYGEFALDNKIDFYYLRMRLGIAEFINTDYLKAEEHFEKASNISQKDTISKEYLYLCKLYSGKEMDARIVSKDLTIYQKKKLNIKKFNFWGGLYTEGGYTFNQNFNNEKSKFRSKNFIYDEQIINKNANYINFGLFHNLSERIKVFHSFSRVQVNSVKQFYDINLGKKDFDIYTVQNEYYINANIFLKNIFRIIPAFHFINTTYKDIIIRYDTTNLTNKANYENKEGTQNDFVIQFAVEKDFKKFTFSLNNSYSELNDQKQVQNGLSVIYYPLGNLNLYLISNLIIHSNKAKDEGYITKVIFEPKVGFKITNFLWVEGYYTLGDFKNYSELNSFIVYNTDNTIRNRFGINLILPIEYNKVEISLRYQNYKQDNYNISYINNNLNTLKTIEQINHKIIGGLKWTF